MTDWEYLMWLNHDFPVARHPGLKRTPQTANKKPQVYKKHRASLVDRRLGQSMHNMRREQTNATKILRNAAAATDPQQTLAGHSNRFYCETAIIQRLYRAREP